jgi:hypothetical protein
MRSLVLSVASGRREIHTATITKRSFQGIDSTFFIKSLAISMESDRPFRSGKSDRTNEKR